jgi:spore coat polysaccharide biosynthesis predicted glycosyltransferase SpsG
MRYVLRSDASLEQGSGHVLRSLAIFQELNSRGYEIVFVGKISNLPWVKEKIRQTGFMEWVDEEIDFIHHSKSDVLVLDSYDIDPRSSFIKDSKWYKIVTIADDFTPAYSSDLVVRPSLTTVTNESSGRKTLSGPNYFPLRKEIKKVSAISNSNSQFRVVVVGGGTDLRNFASAVSHVLKKSPCEMSVTFVSNDDFMLGIDERFKVIAPGFEAEKAISTANLAFTTASTSAIEFIAREIPIGIACAVPNQEDYYQVLLDLGVAVQIGRFNSERWEFDENVILDFLENESKHNDLREQMKDMLDLKSTSRIVDEILKL